MKGDMWDFFAERPQYRPREVVRLVVERSEAGEELETDATIRVFRLGALVKTEAVAVRFAPTQKQSESIAIGAFVSELAGFGVEMELAGRRLYTAFDVASDAACMPRYGFLCRFDGGDEPAAPVDDLVRNHITWVQFYDWMYRHEQLLPEGDAFTDLMGRSMELRHVRLRVQQCRERGLCPIAYGAVYAASYPFAEKHKDWLLYDGAGKPLDFIGRLRYMDISEGTGWRAHIERQFVSAVSDMGFAGIHMDTYGYPKDAMTADGRAVHLAECFPSLIDETRAYIQTETRHEPLLVFNNVGNWPVDTVAGAAQDAIYIEVWPPYERYRHLCGIARQARALNPDKPLILAAYAKAFMTCGRKEAWHSTFLLQSVLAACGAHPLLLGEQGGVLTQAYYADHYTELEPLWRARQRRYSDFVVRWGELLYATDYREVGMTHAFGDNVEYMFDGASASLELEGGRIGVVINELPTAKVLHLIDLRASDDLWQLGKRPSETPYALTIDVLVLKAPTRVYAASPEVLGGGAVELPRELFENGRGLYLRVRINTEQPWTMMVIE